MGRPVVKAVLGALLLTAIPLAGRASLFPIFGPKIGGVFVVKCSYDHRLTDDPIVFPALPGASHSHDFFGNLSTNAFSTYSSMRAAGTNCQRPGDASGYWVPTLLYNGQPVTPYRMSAYYLPKQKAAGTFKAFPPGLKIVAGNSKATGPQSTGVVNWNCGADGPVTPTSQVPTCPSGYYLVFHVQFPDCWNGTQTDSTDHKSHMAYSNKGQCPTGYPVSTPGILLNVVYPIQGGPGVSFSSGSAFTGHGDFFNGWNQTELDRLVQDCTNAGKACGTGG
jgi:hypothetical protein